MSWGKVMSSEQTWSVRMGDSLSLFIAKGRRFVGCELNPEYAALAEERIGATEQALVSVGSR